MDMQDYIAQLSSAPPTDAMTQALRRKQSLGELGMVTGDEALSKVGASMVDSAGSEAWRNQQTDSNRQAVLGRALEAQADRASRESEGSKNRAAEFAIAKIRAAQAGGLSVKDVMRYRQALGRDLNRAGLPETNSAIAGVQKAIDELGPGVTDFPGVGVLGQWNQGQKARSFRLKLAPLRNIVLRDRSGAAVTDQEFERFKEELLGEKWLASDKDFKDAWEGLKSRIKAHEDAIVSSYDPEIVDLYYGEERAPKDEGENFSTMSDEELRKIAGGK